MIFLDLNFPISNDGLIFLNRERLGEKTGMFEWLGTRRISVVSQEWCTLQAEVHNKGNIFLQNLQLNRDDASGGISHYRISGDYV